MLGIPMRLRIITDTSLHHPDELEGCIAWHDIEIQDLDDKYDLQAIGTARTGVVNSFYLSDKVRRTKHPDGDEIEPLHALILANDPHGLGLGLDVLYFSSVKISPERQGRNIELAVVLRVCDLMGMGCALAAINVEEPDHVAYWARIGFERTPGTSGLLHADLDREPPGIIEDEDTGSFHIVPHRRWGEPREDN